MSSVSSAGTVGQLQISVAKMQLDQTEQDGKNAVELIQSASPPEAAAGAAPANAPAGVGQRVNFTA